MGDFSTDLNDNDLLSVGIQKIQKIEPVESLIERLVEMQDFQTIIQVLEDPFTIHRLSFSPSWTLQSIVERYPNDGEHADMIYEVFCRFPGHISVSYVMGLWILRMEERSAKMARSTWDFILDKAFQGNIGGTVSDEDYQYVRKTYIVHSVLLE